MKYFAPCSDLPCYVLCIKKAMTLRWVLGGVCTQKCSVNVCERDCRYDPKVAKIEIGKVNNVKRITTKSLPGRFPP